MTSPQHKRDRKVYARKRQAERWGRWAELWVAFVLRCRGFRLMARRYRCPFGEIDLIVQKNNTLQFIEVKYRSSVDDPAAALPSFSSRKRLHRAARYFIMKHPQSDDMEQNFHIVLVTKTLRLQWFDNVFIDFD